MVQGEMYKKIVTACAYIGTSALFAIGGMLLFVLLAAILGFTFSYATLLWLFVFLYPFGFALGVRMLRTFVPEREGAFVSRLIIGYVGYIVLMVLVFTLGLYGNPWIWGPVTLLTLIVITLFIPTIRRHSAQVLRFADGEARNDTEHEGHSQHSLFSDQSDVIHLETTRREDEKDTRK